uniref:Peptidase S1 domain-containing protein n=1 Tax=Cyprinus carpio TaxID=7962 RepID=A0A8C1JKB2_CYPCA
FMMTIISLLLLASLLPHMTFTVNGTEAKPHSRPYMVSVQKNWLQICGGFLISDYSETLTVVVGAHDLKNKTEGSVCIRVKSYHQHPDFTEEPVMNDMMLLKVTILHSVCSVAGWGRLDTNGSLSNRLMEIHGDSGGPLVCGKTAVGVTSFGDPNLCNSPELPEVYMKVSTLGRPDRRR